MIWLRYIKHSYYAREYGMKKEVIILSGFLGSGKTTVLQNLIQASKNKKIAVLLNDFGDTPIDSTLIEIGEHQTPVLEIGGGSIFCSCLKEAFIKAMLTLTASDAERIFVEASGMSDPAGVWRMLSLAKLDAFYEEPFVICLFDPQKSLKLSNVLEVIPRQIKAANLTVLTKSDVTSKEERDAARIYIQSVQSNMPIVESSNGSLDLQNLPRIPSNSAISFLQSYNSPETRPDSFMVQNFVPNLDQLLETLSASKDLLRVKGYVETPAGPMFITDGPTGITATKAHSVQAPLTVICMQNQGEQLEHAIQNILEKT